GKRLPHSEQILSGIFIWFQQNGWMDTDLMKNYVDYIKNLINNNLAIIVYDSFRGYLEEFIKKKFQDYGFDLAVIPGSLTSICQPLDVMINKPFKNNLRKE
ncbi:13756_t:CDS:1, partial [Funneliformis geosporum]